VHEAGLVHGDVTASNVSRKRDGTLRLGDFGTASAIAPHETQALPEATLATVAPERLRGDAATPASDVYAAACLIYQALTGDHPLGLDAGTEDPVGAILARSPNLQHPRVPEPVEPGSSRRWQAIPTTATTRPAPSARPSPGLSIERSRRRTRTRNRPATRPALCPRSFRPRLDARMMPEPSPDPVLVVGSIAYDTVKTPFDEVQKSLGGSATYFSGAASLFGEVDVVGTVGGDFDLDDLAFLEDRGVDLSGVEVREDGETFHWEGEYHYDMNTRTTHATDLNVLEDFEPVVPEHARDTPLVFLANIDPDLQLDVLDQLTGDPLVAMDTMNFWIENRPQALKDVLARVDVLLINDEEAREMADTPHLTEAMRRIQGLGPDIVVVKKGEHGSVLANGSEWFAAPAFLHADVTDPTGAGDAFAGGFMGTLAETHELDDDALRRGAVHGTAAASLVIEDFGPARLSQVDRGHLDKRAAQLGEFARFPPIE